jgi:hypothetical protein
LTPEKQQDGGITLRHIEAERDFPRELVIVPWTKADVEAPLSIGETG